jgi:hypothetical protein
MTHPSPESPLETARGIVEHPDMAWHHGTEVRMARALVEIDKALTEPIMPESGYEFREHRLQHIRAILDGTTEGQGA